VLDGDDGELMKVRKKGVSHLGCPISKAYNTGRLNAPPRLTIVNYIKFQHQH
jgi:hypothetical protein